MADEAPTPKPGTPGETNAKGEFTPVAEATTTKAYYAWTPIVASQDDMGRNVVNANIGDEVTASSLGLTEDQFQELVDGGSIRNMKYPDMGGFDGSPTDFYKQQANAG